MSAMISGTPPACSEAHGRVPPLPEVTWRIAALLPILITFKRQDVG